MDAPESALVLAPIVLFVLLDSITLAAQLITRVALAVYHVPHVQQDFTHLTVEEQTLGHAHDAPRVIMAPT